MSAKSLKKQIRTIVNRKVIKSNFGVQKSIFITKSSKNQKYKNQLQLTIIKSIIPLISQTI